MARRTTSRMDKRRELEAAEALEANSGTKKKKSKRKRSTKAKASTKRKKRSKAKSTARKRLVWGVFNGNMKEEGRFPYYDRAAAEEKLEKLKTKSPKKMFFIQPIKEEIADAPPPETDGESA